ncbi:hypothetical protein ACFQZE_07190 [Paenibacillus sp. GCM10027627]|uniref:hypothetical protein n=1 Tax=unclassified Paenibacillus TaxID=185978 RepID=UPI00363C4B7E
MSYADVALLLEKRVIETFRKYNELILYNKLKEAEQAKLNNEDFYQRWLIQETKDAETLRYIKHNITKSIEYMNQYRVTK